MTPTARTLKRLRDDGWLCETVERWNPAVRIRNDLFGIGDVLAVRERDVLLVQCTSRSNISSRVFKIRSSPNLTTLLRAGIRVEVHGWGRLASGMALRVVDMRQHLETT